MSRSTRAFFMGMKNSDASSTVERRGLALHWQIVIALVLAVVAGLTLPAKVGGFEPMGFLAFFGRLFLQALQMLVVPLIVSAVISAIAKLGGEHALGRLGLKTIAFYLGSTALAVVIGLTVSNALQPGRVPPDVSKAMISAAKVSAPEVAEKIADKGAGDILGILARMVPPNVIDAATRNSDMLALITFSILFGYFITRLADGRREVFAGWWENFYDVMVAMATWIIRFTPYGVFALVAPTIAKTGTEAFLPLAKFFFGVVLALGLHLFVALPLVLLAFGLSPARHFRMVAPALLTAFSTASSAATLPLTMGCLEKGGVPRRICGFTLPLGATVNMDGTALYECAVVLFIAQIYGVELSLAAQLSVVVLALLTSIGVAGIPAASMVAIVVILGAVGLPAEAIGIVLAVDRLLDMCRTSVNVFSDTVAAAVIAKTEESRANA